MFENGRPARIDDYARRVWGIGCVGTTAAEPLPAGIETPLMDFIELVGIAVASAEARERPVDDPLPARRHGDGDRRGGR